MPSTQPELFSDSFDAFHEDAQAAVVLSDFGGKDYHTGLRRLLASLDADAKLSKLGQMIFRNTVSDILKTRLRVIDRLKRYESTRAAPNPIDRPLVITGLVRTGSTALHYLMGQDPGLQKLEYWLAAQPQPRPPRETWASNPDYEAAVKELDFLYSTTPDLMAVHEMNADWPEECRHILALSFTDDRFESAATLTGYNDWYHGTTHAITYALHRRVVELIGSTDREHRWLFKYPVHLRQLPAFFDVYPDACIIQTHRDPRTVVASYASFISKIRNVHEGEVDIAAIAREQMESWAHAAEAGMAARERLPAEQFFDLQFSDFMRDPIGSVKRVYAHFDQVLSAEGEMALRAWQRDHPQAKHGQHAYDSEATGISESEILDRFAGYMEQYGLER
jgi:hypothetical protein